MALDRDSDGDGIGDAAEAGSNPATPIDTDGVGILGVSHRLLIKLTSS